MSNIFSDLSFRSGFFLDNYQPGNEIEISEEVGFNPVYAVMRVAVPSGQQATEQNLPVAVPSIMTAEKKGLRGWLMKNFVTPEIPSEIAQPKVPAQEANITNTSELFNVVDFKIPIARNETGHFILDTSRQPIVEKIRGHAKFDEALFSTMVFANPSLSRMYNQQHLPRIAEGDAGFMSMLTSVDLKTSDGITMLDFAKLRAVEDFLDHHNIGFNGLDPVIRDRVDLNALNGSTNLISLPHAHCRGPANGNNPYQFGIIETPLTVIHPEFAIAAHAQPVVSHGNKISNLQSIALRALDTLEKSARVLQERGFIVDFEVDSFDDRETVYVIDIKKGADNFVFSMQYNSTLEDPKISIRSENPLISESRRIYFGDPKNLKDFYVGTVNIMVDMLQTVFDNSVFANKFMDVSTKRAVQEYLPK